MNTLRTGALDRWWPATQSMDLVLGGAAEVASAVETELRHMPARPEVEAGWYAFDCLDSAFEYACHFAHFPDYYLVLPSRSRWSVLWNNCRGFDGYDSLCWCLTQNHQLTTLHWWASDVTTTFQPGAGFSFRRWVDGKMEERYVYCAREDRRWLFDQGGEPLPQEDLVAYQAKLKRDRLNEHAMAQLLVRLGAAPWFEEFYDIPSRRCFVMRFPRVSDEGTSKTCQETLLEMRNSGAALKTLHPTA